MSRFGYDPNEERDDHGRWSGGSGDPGKMSDKAINKELDALEKDGTRKTSEERHASNQRNFPSGLKGGTPEGPRNEKEKRYDALRAEVDNRTGSQGVKRIPDANDMTGMFARRSGFGRTKILDNAELFSAGTWNGMRFNESDIDGIVTAFSALGLAGRVPIKLGHSGDDARELPESQYALGWVQSIWRDNKRMLSRIEIPEKIFEAVKDGFLKFVSIELLHDVKAGTRVIPYVLDAVALLGTDQPAVGILKDLQALTMSRSAYSHRGRVTFRRGDSTKGKSTMDEREEAALRQQLADQKVANTTLQSQFTASENERKKDRAATRRREIKSMFEAAVTAKKILPKRLEAFTKSNKTDDDARVVDVSDGDVESFISTFTEADSAEIKKGEKGTAKGGTAGSGEGDTTEFVGKPNHEVFAALSNAQLLKMGGKRSDYKALQEAGAVVMRTNPKLAKAYHNDPNGEYVAE